MSFYIDENLFFDFYLNNIRLPLTFNNITSMLITSNIYDLLPQIRLDINDNLGLLDKGMLTDGTTLSVAIGSDSEKALENIMEFVLIGVPEQNTKTNSNSFLIYGVLNNPKFLRCIEPFAFTGTSSNALSSIALKCGLKFDGEVTADEMTWINGTRNYGQFSQFIRDHGWSGTSSFMMSAVNLHRTLLYRDINSLRPKYIITNSSNADNEKSFRADEMTFQNKAGIYNYSYGYKTSAVQFNLNSAEDKYFSEISYVKDNSAVLNMNSDVYNDLGIIRNDLYPINLGNVHTNYEQAFYQNQRYKALNSIKGEAIFSKSTPIDILDKVQLARTDAASKSIDTEKASSWVVEAKTLAISQQRYFEKLTLSSTGLEADLFNNLI